MMDINALKKKIGNESRKMVGVVPPTPPIMIRPAARPAGPSGFAVYRRLPPNFLIDHDPTLDMPDNFLYKHHSLFLETINQFVRRKTKQNKPNNERKEQES